MPTFAIEQYELHVMTYDVDAATEADAVARLYDGLVEPVDDSLEFCEIDNSRGLPAGKHAELADALRTRGVSVDAVIPSICSIRVMDESTSSEPHV